ncbi:MAG: glycosyltransferase, partial [Proteobacteria bacterium]|nr:glycosyltransferase [Pseudomonadota bacterium]
VIHPYSLKLYNIEIPDYDMVQTPVIPVAVSLKYQTHWIYNDEFAEIHLKDITARNMMGGFVPSAGVGTALSRRALNTLEKINGGSPFSKNSLTEDYDSALKIHLAHLKTRFLFKTLPQTKPAKKWIWFGKTINKSTKEYIATRSLFPKTYRAALRQRTRWMMGISLQEWNNIGWPGDFVTLYSLAHDRKSVFSNFITLIAYLVSVYWLIDYIYGEFFPGTPVLSQLLAQHPSAYVLIVICSSFMIIRLTQRFLLTARIYGFWAGLTSIPRVFYANFLNANTAFLAIYLFLKAKFFKKTIQWIKTTNAFPTDIK